MLARLPGGATMSRLQDLPAGWGIVVDDVAAALAACAVLHAAALAWKAW